MDANDLKLLKFTKLTLFMDEEYKRTKSIDVWALGLDASIIMCEMIAKCSKAKVIDKELGKYYKT